MEQRGSGQRGCRKGGRAGLVRFKRRRCPRLVMIFDKPDKLFLIPQVGAQMKPYALSRVMFKAVVEAFVVTVIKPLLLKLPFLVPVRLSHEENVGMTLPHSLDHFRPVLFFRTRPCTMSPCALEDGRHEQHRHIAAHPVALCGKRSKSLGGRLPQTGVKTVELHHIGPGCKVWVPSEGQDLATGLDEFAWLL